jgi:uncharacterized protein (DUF2141 family)
MKKLVLIGLLGIMLACCASAPTITDNGNPGQIKAIVFYDTNRNGKLDSGETGSQTRIAISQDVSCPPQNDQSITWTATDANGVAVIKDLKPGKYCVFADGNMGATTQMTLDVYLSSDQEVVVTFGVVKE